MHTITLRRVPFDSSVRKYAWQARIEIGNVRYVGKGDSPELAMRGLRKAPAVRSAWTNADWRRMRQEAQIEFDSDLQKSVREFFDADEILKKAREEVRQARKASVRKLLSLGLRVSDVAKATGKDARWIRMLGEVALVETSEDYECENVDIRLDEELRRMEEQHQVTMDEEDRATVLQAYEKFKTTTYIDGMDMDTFPLFEYFPNPDVRTLLLKMGLSPGKVEWIGNAHLPRERYIDEVLSEMGMAGPEFEKLKTGLYRVTRLHQKGAPGRQVIDECLTLLREFEIDSVWAQSLCRAMALHMAIDVTIVSERENDLGIVDPAMAAALAMDLPENEDEVA